MERTRILVWDLPLRVFHWLLALSFAGAFLTAEAERVRDVHVVLGYTFLGLLAFRLVWGVAGSRYARFRSFLYGPRAVITYLQSLLARRPIHYVGHNPAGSWAIYAILILGVAVGASGYAVHIDAGGRWLESLHEGVSNVLLALVVIHVAGVIVGSFAHRENLVAAMLTGYKSGQAVRGDSRNSLGYGGGADCSCCRILDWGCRDRVWIRAGRQGDDGRRASPIPSFAPWRE